MGSSIVKRVGRPSAWSKLWLNQPEDGLENHMDVFNWKNCIWFKQVKVVLYNRLDEVLFVWRFSQLDNIMNEISN